jgi:hypothetical protein
MAGGRSVAFSLFHVCCEFSRKRLETERERLQRSAFNRMKIVKNNQKETPAPPKHLPFPEPSKLAGRSSWQIVALLLSLGHEVP